MTCVAMFSTYAPSEGFGGPARIFHQRRVLEDAGHTVVHVVLQASASRGEVRRQDLLELVERPYRASIDHIYNDVDLAERARADDRLIQRVIGHLRQHRVDAIMLEQPYLSEIVAEVAADLDVPVVYACHNIEHRLLRDLERFHPDHRRHPDRSDEVRRLEHRAIDISTRVTAIAPSDQKALLDDFGCTSVLVPNGTSVSDMALPRSPGGRHDVHFSFAGSAYWPNTEGFAQVATPSLAFLPPTVRVQVAGSVGRELLRYRSIVKHHSINASRIVVRDFLPMEELVEMMSSSCAVLVPVFIGEGSNLKSADALASGAPVIMTRRATYGYEDILVADDEGVTVVDTAPEFRAAMARSLQQEPTTAPVGTTRRSLLRWPQRLSPLVDVVASL